MPADTPKVGRPPVKESLRRKVRGLRFSDEEWAEVQTAAEAAGVTVAAWVRQRCLGRPGISVRLG